MSLSKLLKLYNLEKYEEYITYINIRPTGKVELKNLDGGTVTFTKDQFISKIIEIYGYSYDDKAPPQVFHLAGKLDTGEYFYFYHSFYIAIHLNIFYMRIITSKDIEKVIKYDYLDRHIIMIKSPYKL
jgi:hypothetical protein